MKTTCRKSWPENLFQVLNLTFDPSFKVKVVITIKRPHFSLIIGAILQNIKTDHENPWPANVLPFRMRLILVPEKLTFQ